MEMEDTAFKVDADIEADAMDGEGDAVPPTEPTVVPVPLMHVVAAVNDMGQIVGFGFEWSERILQQSDWRMGAAVLNNARDRLGDAMVIGDMLAKLVPAAPQVQPLGDIYAEVEAERG
jgi:hypothetical protein